MLLVLMVMTAGALGSIYLALWMTLKAFGLSDDPVTLALVTTVGLVVTLEVLLIAPAVIWIGVRLTHKVAGPLVRINAALQQMARGDFHVHLRLRKGDALGEVAEAINALAASLRQEPVNRA